MKKGIALILTAVLLLTGCGSSSAQAGTQENTDAAQEEAVVTETETASTDAAEKTDSQTDSQEPAASENADTTEVKEAEAEAPQGETGASSDTLVLYFSRTGEQYVVGVIDKGNTAIVAEMIAEQTGADLFEVLPADDHYPMTYEALTDVAKQEQNDNARPAYSGELPDLSKYSTIFIGAPVWWGDWPMIMYTVFENSDFSGKTLIPFSTHEGSGLSGFDKKLEGACPDSTVGKGLAIEGNDAQNNQEKARESVSGWLTELGFDMAGRNDEQLIRDVYIKMYEGMIAKDEATLREALDDSFVLVHMTGMRQSREEFISAVLDGTLNYYSAEHENMPVKINGDTAVLTGQSYVAAAVFGGGRSNWRLQQKCSLKKIDGLWNITRSVASTY